MKKLIPILISAAVLCGCRTYDFAIPLADGSTATARVRTLFNDANLEELTWSTNGLVVKGYSQGVNSEAIAAVTQAAVEGAVKGAANSVAP